MKEKENLVLKLYKWCDQKIKLFGLKPVSVHGANELKKSKEQKKYLMFLAMKNRKIFSV